MAYKNPEDRVEYDRARYRANKAQVKAASSAYRVANKEKVAEYRAIHAKRITYNTQKSQAKSRGIEFLFSFEEWIEWWGDDYVKRGREGHELVMARNGDIGPYAPHNVKKITASENQAEKWGNIRKKEIKSATVYKQFQTTYLDPDTPTTLPTNLARRLAVRPDYKDGAQRRLDSEELLFYNTLLKDKGKEAADIWLNERWEN